MIYDKNSVEMIVKLSDAFGPSGFEDDVLKLARKYAEGLGRIEEDHLRNLYIYRKENKGNRPVLMLDAHSDEVGLMTQAIRPDGTLRFIKVGGWSDNALNGVSVLVRNTEGDYIPGVIASKSVHFMTDPAERNKPLQISNLFIDIGATSAEEAVKDFHAGIGEPVVPDVKCRFDEKHGLFFGKAFDCRIGAAALLETMRRLEGMELPVDVVGVLSSQEELGERGCKVAVNHVKPDIGYVYEGCPADDTFTEGYMVQTAMKKGPMLRYMDVSVICSPRYQRHVLKLASAKGIPAQGAVRQGGGNNAAVINLAGDGVPAVVAGIPSRYAHTANCITAYEDFENAVKLAVETVLSLTPDVIESF